MKLTLDTPENVDVNQGAAFQGIALVFQLENNSAVLRFKKLDSEGKRMRMGTLSVNNASVLDNLINSATSFSDMRDRIYTKLQTKYSGTIV